MEQHHKNTTDNYSLQDLGLKCSAWKRLCLNYPKLMQIIQNLAKIEALPKCIQNKSSKIRNSFSAKIPPLVCSHFVYFGAFKAVEAGCFNGVTGCLLGVSRVSQECLKDVSRVIQGCSKVATKFLKGVPRVF